MGACATKPKVAKDGDKAPIIRPEPEKEAVAVAAEVPAENFHPVDDDQSNKQRSLSNLLKENEQATELAESEATTNPEKQESTEIEKPKTPIIQERSVPIEEAKPSEPVEAAQVEEQLETETLEEPLKEKNPIEADENPVEKKQENIATEEKSAEIQVTILTEKTLQPIEKQESNVTEFETPTATAVVDAATAFEKVNESTPTAMEIKTSQPEMEEQAEEAAK